MKITKILSAAFVAAALLSSAGSAMVIDADIASKTGLGLKQYAQQLKNNAARPHHGHLNTTDTDLLLQDVGKPNSNAYIPIEVPLAKAKLETAIDALGTCDGGAGGNENLFVAVIGGGTHPVDVTVLAFKNAFLAEFDRVMGVNGANILVPGPASAKHTAISQTIEDVDGAIQLLFAPWVHALHAGGLAQLNVFDDVRREAILVQTAAVADSLQVLETYLNAAVANH